MIRLYVESGEIAAKKKSKKATNEIDFLVKFIQHHFPNRVCGVDFEVHGLGGKDTLENSAPILRDIEESDLNVLVFDADNSTNEGGFSVRKKHLEEERARLGLNFELFLWPNNCDDGDFETLLESMINPKHQGVLECFQKFQMCVGGQDPEGTMYALPGLKAEMYTYIEIMNLSDDKRQELHDGYYQFDDPEYWNLSSEAANPLKIFLTNYFKDNAK